MPNGKRGDMIGLRFQLENLNTRFAQLPMDFHVFTARKPEYKCTARP
jgi:hypothetical protein